MDSENNLHHWDLTSETPAVIKKQRLPESHDFGYVSCIKALNFISSDVENNLHAFIGTTTGNLYFYSLEKQMLLKHSVKRSQLLTS